MEKKLFVVGLNGVLYDSIGRVLEYLRHRWNYIMPRSKVTTNNLSCFTGVKEIDVDLLKQLHNPEFYQEMKPVDGAWEALELLSKYGNIISITRRPQNTRMTTRICATRDFGPFVKEIFHQKNGPKVARSLKAKLVIDDNAETATEYSKSKIITYCVLSGYSKSIRKTQFLRPCFNILEAAKDYDKQYSQISEGI